MSSLEHFFSKLDEPTKGTPVDVPAGVSATQGESIQPQVMPFASFDNMEDMLSAFDKARKMILVVRQTDMLAIIKGEKRITNLPQDVKFEACSYDFYYDAVVFRMWSSTFDTVALGSQFKHFEPSFVDIVAAIDAEPERLVVSEPYALSCDQHTKHILMNAVSDSPKSMYCAACKNHFQLVELDDNGITWHYQQIGAK